MTKPYSSPPTNLRSLRDRLTQVAERQGVVFGRLQRHVAMIVVAQFAATLTNDTGAPLLLVKGGSSLELRRGIPDSRTSKDFDTVARRDIELIHEQLADAGETGWEGFTAIFTAPEEIDVPGMPVKPRRFTAKLRPGFRNCSDRGLLRRSRQCRPIRHPHLRRARPRGRTRSSRRTLHDHSLANRAEAARSNCRARRTEGQRPRSRPGGLAAS